MFFLDVTNKGETHKGLAFSNCESRREQTICKKEPKAIRNKKWSGIICVMLTATAIFLATWLVALIFEENDVKVVAQETCIVHQTPVYHVHSGQSAKSGGCYTVPHYKNVQVGTNQEICGGSIGYSGPYYYDNGVAYYVGECARCHKEYVGNGSTTTCGVVRATVPVYEKRIDYYNLGCNHTELDAVGTFEVEYNSADWVLENQATLKIRMNEGESINIGGYTMNGNTLDDSTVKLICNGAYTFAFIPDGNTRADSLVININNIDRDGPVLTSVNWNKADYVANNAIEVTAVDNGCGLADDAYSWDGGASWCSDSVLRLSDNRTVNLKVRDRLGNSSGQTIVIDNIDNTAPQVSLALELADNKYSGKVVANVHDDGAGLPEDCFSWNGGDWCQDSSIQVSSNGVVDIKVRDKVGNIAEASLQIDSIEIPKPTQAPGQGGDSGDAPGTGNDNSGNGDGSPTIGKPDDNSGLGDGTSTPGGPKPEPGKEVKKPEPTKEVAKPKVKPTKPVNSQDDDGRQLPEDDLDGMILTEKPDITPVIEEEYHFTKELDSAGPELEIDILKNGGNSFWNRLTAFEKIMLILGIVAGIVALLMLFLLALLCAVIWDKGEDKNDRIIGFKLVGSKDGRQELIVSQDIYDRAQTGDLRITLSYLYVFFHKGEDIIIRIPEREAVCREIAHRIDVDA